MTASYFAEYDQGRIRDLQVGRLYLLRQSVGFPQECDATAYRDQKEQFHSSRHQPGCRQTDAFSRISADAGSGYPPQSDLSVESGLIEPDGNGE